MLEKAAWRSTKGTGVVSPIPFRHSNISNPISFARTLIVLVLPVPAGPVIARIRYDIRQQVGKKNYVKGSPYTSGAFLRVRHRKPLTTTDGHLPLFWRERPILPLKKELLSSRNIFNEKNEPLWLVHICLSRGSHLVDGVRTSPPTARRTAPVFFTGETLFLCLAFPFPFWLFDSKFELDDPWLPGEVVDWVRFEN